MIGLLGLVLVLASGCSLLVPGKPQTSGDPVSAILATQQQVQDQIRQAMQQAAEQMKVSLQLDTFVFVSRYDFTAASALVSSFDSLVFEDPVNRVADLGLVFLSLPPKANIPVGFFKVRVFILQSKVELLDANGQPVISLPMERVGYVDGSSNPMILVTGCDITIPYNQIRQPANSQTLSVAVRFSWCDKLIH
jgi:hypothetical protein